MNKMVHSRQNVPFPAAIFFLFCWRSIRSLFMNMVDTDFACQSVEGIEGFCGSIEHRKSAAAAGAVSTIEDDENSSATRERNEEIFFGRKDREFLRPTSAPPPVTRKYF